MYEPRIQSFDLFCASLIARHASLIFRLNVQAKDQGSVSGDQARAEQVEGLDPRLVHERRLLRQPRLRDRSRRADVLLAARTHADARPVGATRRPAAGAVGLRSAPPAA